MVGMYTLVIDIVAGAETTSQKEFVEQVAPCLSYLDALKGSFDRTPCHVAYYPPHELPENPDNDFWSLRAVVMISVGKQRAEYLVGLYMAVARLIALELPHFEVRHEIGGWKFS